MNRFLAEIIEQPEVIQNLIRYYSHEEGKKSLAAVTSLINTGETKTVVLTGMGSSFFVAYAAAILLNQSNVSAYAINASELLHYRTSLLKKDALLICISQSGESYEVKELLKTLPEGLHCAGIVNDESSTLATQSEWALPCKAGREEMTSTKSYTATSLVAYVLGSFISNSWNDETAKRLSQLGENFRTKLIAYPSWLQDALDFMGDIDTLQIIARGPCFSTACQSALMFKEALQIPATGILGGEFRHGPMEMVQPGFKAILFAAKGKTFDQSIGMANDIASFGGKVLVITNELYASNSKHIKQLAINEPDEFLFSIIGILPMQLFVDAYAKQRGREAGSFSRGAKVTTIE